MRIRFTVLFICLSIVSNFYIASYPQEKLSKPQVDSLINLGKNHLEKKEWTGALGDFGDVLDEYPNNIAANYYFAITQRETGKFRFPVERILRWNNAEKHFKLVIKLDSSFKDIYYQYAILELYRENYFKAIKLAQRELSINGSQDNVLKGIFHLYDVMLYHENNSDAEKWLKSKHTVYNQYFLGELYRQNGKFEKADSIFHLIIRGHKNIPLVPVYLSLVRLYVQTNQPEKADKTYWKAVNSISNFLGANFLLNDFIYIINSNEYKILGNPISLSDFKKSMKIFWMTRNPLPSLPYNMGLIENYRRLIYAEKNFRYDGFKHTGFRYNPLDVIKFPPWYYKNNKFNDKGIIYIRFGEPDEKLVTVPGAEMGNYNNSDIETNESWLYRQTKRLPQRIFFFTINKNAPPNYWTLVPGFTDPRILRNLVSWDPRFFHVSQNSNTWSDLLKEGVKSIETGLNSDRFIWPDKLKPLDAYYSVGWFKKNEKQDLFRLAFAVNTDELFKGLNNGDSLSVEASISVYDSLMHPVFNKNKEYKIHSNSDSHIYKDLFIDNFEFPLDFQRYNISFDISIPKENRLFGSRFVQRIPNLYNNKLACSSIIQAFKISPGENPGLRNLKNIKIIQNPTLQFDKLDNVYTYYEIYNLAMDKNGQSNYTVNYNLRREGQTKSVWDFLSGLFGTKTKYNLTIKDTYSDTTKNVFNYIAFDISQLKSGLYKLKITIKDNINGEKASTSTKLVVK